MRELSSSEFRRSFARLTDPVAVTVLGRPIGQWIPASYALTVQVDGDAITIDPPPLKGQTVTILSRMVEAEMVEAGAHPAVRKDDQLRYVNPVRPAPKPTRKKR